MLQTLMNCLWTQNDKYVAEEIIFSLQYKILLILTGITVIATLPLWGSSLPEKPSTRVFVPWLVSLNINTLLTNRRHSIVAIHTNEIIYKKRKFNYITYVYFHQMYTYYYVSAFASKLWSNIKPLQDLALLVSSKNYELF